MKEKEASITISVLSELIVSLYVFQEAIVIVLDVGPSMNQAPPGNCTTLETARDVITMILQRKVN